MRAAGAGPSTTHPLQRLVETGVSIHPLPHERWAPVECTGQVITCESEQQDARQSALADNIAIAGFDYNAIVMGACSSQYALVTFAFSSLKHLTSINITTRHSIFFRPCAGVAVCMPSQAVEWRQRIIKGPHAFPPGSFSIVSQTAANPFKSHLYPGG